MCMSQIWISVLYTQFIIFKNLNFEICFQMFGFLSSQNQNTVVVYMNGLNTKKLLGKRPF